MIQPLRGIYSIIRISLKHSCQKLKLFCAYTFLWFVTKCYVTLIILFYNFLGFSLKKIFSKYHFVKDTAYTKHICNSIKSNCAKVWVRNSNYLRSNITSCSTSYKKIFFFINKCSQVKIDNFYFFISVGDKNILWF